MQKELGVPLIVDNRPGASGNLAASALVQAPADGYTILHGESSVLYTNEHLSKAPYSPEKDFTYIGAIGRSPFTLVVNPRVGIQTLNEFVEYAKANPAKINYGTPGVGSPQRIAMEIFQQEYGIKLTHVAYRGGAPALQDVRAGQIESMMVDLGVSLPYIRDGGLRALAVYAPQRLASLPSVPTPTFATAACAPLRCTRPSDWRACRPCRLFPSSGSAAFPLSSCMASSVPGACPSRWSNG